MASYDEAERQNYHYVVCEVDEAAAGLSRDAIIAALWAERVIARRYFHPGCHAMEPYRSKDPSAGERLPATLRVAGRVLLLPNGQAVSGDDVRACCALIRQILAQREEVAAHFAANPPQLGR